MEQKTTISVVKLRLGSCLTGPTKRMHADFDEVGRLCGIIKSKVVRAVERLCEDENLLDAPVKVGECSLQNFGYRKGREVAPQVDSQIVSDCTQAALKDFIKTRMPWNYEGVAKNKLQAAMLGEGTRPVYGGNDIPIPSKDIAICIQGDICGKTPIKRRDGNTDRVKLFRYGQSSAVLLLPLFSEKSGRKQRDILVRFQFSTLPLGLKLVLKNVASGQYKLAGSKLVKRKDQWYFHLVYHHPCEDLGLDQSRVATIELSDPADTQHPFTISWPEGNRGIGHGRMLETAFLARDSKIKYLKSKHRCMGTGPKGHGRTRFYRDTRPISRANANLLNDFIKKVSSEAIRLCSIYNCGTIKFKSPSTGARAHSWFAKRGINFNWTALMSHIAAVCQRKCIRFPIKKSEFQEVES